MPRTFQQRIRPVQSHAFGVAICFVVRRSIGVVGRTDFRAT